MQLKYDMLFKLFKFQKKLLQKKYGHNNSGKITVRFRHHLKYSNKLRIFYNFPLFFENYKIIQVFKNITLCTGYIALALFQFNFIKKLYYILCYNFDNIGVLLNTVYFNYCNYYNNAIKIDFLKIQNGNVLCLKNIPVGTIIFNIEKRLGFGGVFARSGGCFGVVMKHSTLKQITFIKLPSKLYLKLNFLNRACIGRVSNTQYKKIIYNKAGNLYNLGIRPHVRGVAMNAVDHPHGGGRGKTKGGRPSVSLWGVLTKGKRTVYNKVKILLRD